MTRALLLVLALATRTLAVDTTFGLWAPTSTLPGGSFVDFTTTANQLRCVDFVPHYNAIGFTKIAWAALDTNSGTVGIAIYTKAGVSQVWSISTLVSIAGVQTATVPAFDLTVGAIYRLCWCHTSTNGQYVGASTQGDGALPRGPLPLIWNLFSDHVGIAATSCSAGIPPGTTGSLTPQLTAFDAPAVWMEP